MTRQLELTIAAALIAASCATIDAPTPALQEARATMRVAEGDSAVLAGAPLELKRANEALDRANHALISGEPIAEIDHHAYIATRRAQLAIAVGAAKNNEAAIKAAEVERERARADVRTLEAQMARTDANAQRAQAAAALQQASSAQQQASAAQQQADLAARQAAASQAQAAASQSQAEQSRAQAEASASRAADLQRQLAELEALKTDRGRVVTLGDVLFEFNRADVKPVAQMRLRKLADFLRQYEDRKVLIEGYTDNIGSATYNEQLSFRRAEAIRAQLALLGVGTDRMGAIGYGKDYPVASNNTDTNRAMNRRVEVIISDNDQPVPQRR